MTRPFARAAYALSEAARIGLFWGQSALSARLAPPVEAPPLPEGVAPVRTADVLRELRALMARDWRNIEDGLYRMPHDLFESPAWVARAGRRYFRDLSAVNRRRVAGEWDEVRRTAAEADFPSYYLRNFHFQTGGYLSRDSAALYDYQVEVLFGGGADAMRRQALAPLYEAVRHRGATRCRLVDVACGTGRFLSFVKDNYPRLPVTGLDLSPHYLETARHTLRHWRGVELIHARAEASGLPDAAFDFATCIFLFHELPGPVRAAVAAETARVLAPGGTLVFMDSIQPGDHPPFDALLHRFPVLFHEPFYAHYLEEDLEALFAQAGFAVRAVERHYFARLMVLEKRA
jgi:ubiquinone/menaquinone biosynthesis C-methylase UbiE